MKILFACCAMFAGWGLGLPSLEAATLDCEMDPRDNFSKAAFRLWLPDDSATIRGVAILVPGLEGDGRPMADDSFWQEFARRQNFALVACFLKGRPNYKSAYYHAHDGTGKALLDALKTFAGQARHPELENAPLILWGHSAGGQFNYEFACWKPQRVIAFIVNKGGYYAAKSSPETRHVPAILFAGEKDTELRVRNIKALFDVNRRQGALWALAIEPNAGHEPGRTRDVALAFFETIIPLRLPVSSASASTSSAPVAIKELKEDAGWLGDLKTSEIRAASQMAGKSKDGCAWMPDEAMSGQWQAFVKGEPLTAVARSTATPEPPPPATGPETPVTATDGGGDHRFVCLVSIEAYDPSNPSKMIGHFDPNSTLTLGAVHPTDRMIEVTFTATDGSVIHALCKSKDLGKSE